MSKTRVYNLGDTVYWRNVFSRKVQSGIVKQYFLATTGHWHYKIQVDGDGRYVTRPEFRLAGKSP